MYWEIIVLYMFIVYDLLINKETSLLSDYWPHFPQLSLEASALHHSLNIYFCTESVETVKYGTKCSKNVF